MRALKYGIVWKRPVRRLRVVLRYWWPRRLTMEHNPPIYAWLWWNIGEE